MGRGIARSLSAMGMIVGAGVALALLSAGPAAAIAPGNGTVHVQLTTAAGVDLHLAGVEISAVSSNGSAVEGWTGAAGAATLSQVYSPTTVGISTDVIPPEGAGTYAPAKRAGVDVTPGVTSNVDLALGVGATVSGSLAGPSSAIDSGVHVVALGQSAPYQVVDATSDAAGRYAFFGLSSGTYTIEASPGPTGEPTEWKTRVMQQHGASPAWQVALSTHFLHTSYDLVVGAESSSGAPLPALSGALVSLIDAGGNVVASQRVSTLLDFQQLAQFEVPSGTYRVELMTTATPTVPEQTLWLSGAETRNTFTSDVGAAAQVSVGFGSLSSTTGYLG